MQKVKFLNKESIVKKLIKLALKAKERNKNIKKVILFGSLANNTYTGISDADILIILKESKLRFVDRIPQFLYFFLNLSITVDVFPYTEDEIKKIPFAKRALLKGTILC